MIPFFKPAQLGFWEQKELHNAITEILESGVFTDGPYCKAFEAEVKRMYHIDYAFVAPNATVALDALVKSINPARVYSPAFTWKSLLSVFDSFGSDLSWLDIDRKTWLPRVDLPLSGSEDMLVLNHTFGNVCQVERNWHETIIYDGAQAFGAEIKDFGNATVFGFAPTKPVTCGEGGMIVTSDQSIAVKLEEQQHILLRMSEFNAALGLAYLRKLPETRAKRRDICDYYDKNLPYAHQEMPLSHSHSVYGVLVPDREKVIDKIKGKMEYRVYYEPLKRGLESTEWVYGQILCIPSYVGCPYKDVVELLT